MNPELRELLGRSAFEQRFSEDDSSSLTWENVDEQIREEYRRIAETIALELGMFILPTLQHFTFYSTGKQVDMNLTEDKESRKEKDMISKTLTIVDSPTGIMLAFDPERDPENMTLSGPSTLTVFSDEQLNEAIYRLFRLAQAALKAEEAHGK